MMKDCIQILMGAMGTFGFALFTHTRMKLLPAATGGGLLAWAVYLAVYHLSPSLFLSNFVAAVAVYIWSEVMARIMKAPVTIFLVPGIIPLLPGSYLYYTTLALLNDETAQFQQHGVNTIAVTMGIACGIVITSIVATYIIQTTEQLRAKHQNHSH